LARYHLSIIGTIYPLSTLFHYQYASPCVDGHYQLVRYITYYCTYNMYVKCVHYAKRPTYYKRPTPIYIYAPFPSPFPLSPFPFSLSFPYYLSLSPSPIYIHIICTPFPYTYTYTPFPLYLLIYVLIYVVIWFVEIRSGRRLLFFIEPFPLSPIIYLLYIVKYVHIYVLI
jgi:hypothetical protein